MREIQDNEDGEEDGSKAGTDEDDGGENSQSEPFRKLTVVISGSGSVRIADIGEGVYRVTELTDWSWRYDATSEVSVEVTVEGEDDATVTFTNALNGKNWLNAETRADNRVAANAEHEAPGQSKTGGSGTQRTVKPGILELAA